MRFPSIDPAKIKVAPKQPKEIQTVPTAIRASNDAKALFNACWKSPSLYHQISHNHKEAGQFKNQVVNGTIEAISCALEGSEKNCDTYFAIAEYLTADNRKAENVYGACAFFMDIDCGEDKANKGKGYLNKKEAKQALMAFCNEVRLPEVTHIVDSGNGLHVYWTLTNLVEREQWQVTAKLLKDLTHKFEFKADDSRTSDIASVLRIPGTLNYKDVSEKPVVLLAASEKSIDSQAMLKAIAGAHTNHCKKTESKEVVLTTQVLPKPLSTDPELEKLKSALRVLDPDCTEEVWKLYRLAALAHHACEYPVYAEGIREIAKTWSRGGLQAKSSVKWGTPGASNNRTGEEIFDEERLRFTGGRHRDKPVTVGTIYHDAKELGWHESSRLENMAGLEIIQEYFSLITLGGKMCVLDMENFNHKEGTHNKTLELFNRQDGRLLIIRKAMATLKDVDTAKLASQFFVSPQTICYQGIEFNPVKTTAKYLNLWRGATLQSKEGEWVLIKDFLLNLICNGDNTSYQYLINYIAHAIQKPQEKPGVMIVLLGGQGIGKGTLGRILHKIWGATYLQVHNIDAITGNFNSALEQSYIVFMDEALFSGDRKSADALKSLITEPIININEKHQPSRQMNSYHRFIAATNATHFKNTEKDDRRDFVLRVSEARKGDIEYWEKLNQEIGKGGTAAMLYELTNKDITDFKVRSKPSTEALVDQKLSSLDHYERWWFECLDQGYCLGEGFAILGDEDERGWVDFISTESVIEGIKNTAGGRLYKKPIARDVLQAITRLCPSVQQRQRLVGGTRKRGLLLPELKQGRLEFERGIGGSVSWTKNEEES